MTKLTFYKKLHMKHKRFDASSIVLDKFTLWVVGGYGSEKCKTTELIKIDESPSEGIELPFFIAHHTMIRINKSTIYMIGGLQGNIEFMRKNQF